MDNLHALHTRRRVAFLWLVGGLLLLIATSIVSMLTGDWRWVLDTSPAIFVTLTISLVLLTSRHETSDY